jgi:single-stranded DNA-binding protein
MITLTGNGRLTRDVTLRTTHSGKTVATISVASDRRERDAPPIYIDLIVWQAQATAAAEHLVKGQVVSFTGRFEPRQYDTAARRAPLRARAARRRPSNTGPSPAPANRASPLTSTSPTLTTSRSERSPWAGRRPRGPPSPRANTLCVDGMAHSAN